MSERLTDAAIREALGTALRDSTALAAEALARGDELREAQDNVTALAAAAIDGGHAGVTPTGLVARQGIDAIAALRAEVERLTRAALRTSASCPSCGDDISFPSARATIEDAPADAIEDGAESFCRECNVRARWTCDAETAGSVILDYDEERKEYEATVARLTRERDEAEGARILNANALKAALATNEAMAREDYLNKQAIRVGGVAARELNEEVARLRAAALPEDAEERIAKAYFRDRVGSLDGWTGNPDDNMHSFRIARLVLAAIRGAS